MSGLIYRFVSIRRLKLHLTPIIISLTMILFVWFLVFAGNGDLSSYDSSFDTYDELNNNVNPDLANKVLEEQEAPKDNTDQLIYVDDEVVSVDIGGGTLTDNVFQNIVNKIIEFDPHITVPFSSTFSEKDTTSELKPGSLGYYIEKSLDINIDPNNWDKVLSMDVLGNNYLVLNEKIKANITKSHKGFINLVKKNSFAYPDLYHGNGIVISGGGKYSLQAYSVVSVIRELGNKLPVEILIPSDYEQDEAFCNKISKVFSDCKCIYLDDILEKQYVQNQEFHAFQYKSLALMASSFQNVLLLDADNYPIRNIDHIFDHEAFKENGMVVWPDFWRRTTHPFYYESAEIKIDLTKRIRNFYSNIPLSEQTYTIDEAKNLPYHDFSGALPDPSSETGEFMIDKKKHWKSLVLSLYYNIHGPNVFYHLFTQYSAGQGDKETFLAAAHVLDLPYYQVYMNPTLDMYFEPKEDANRGVAYYQKDFRKDYETKDMLAKKYITKDIASYFDSSKTAAEAMFAHCNLPKFDVVGMAEKDDFTYKETNKHFRALTGKVSLQGLDLEKMITIAYYNEICQKDQSKNMFNYLVKNDFENICKYWKKRHDLVESTQL
ncbi:hypothetical protein QEN19_004159 [Hanseniaspora menglaensis]